jgi:hypothetical protein
MSKYTVTADFIDKYTKDYYAAGSVYETDSQERADELKELGFLGDEIKPRTSRAKKEDAK